MYSDIYSFWYVFFNCEIGMKLFARIELFSNSHIVWKNPFQYSSQFDVVSLSVYQQQQNSLDEKENNNIRHIELVLSDYTSFSYNGRLHGLCFKKNIDILW